MSSSRDASEGPDRPAAAVGGLDPGTVFAGYRIERLLDRGGMGVVYLATDVDLDRAVALKIIAPEHTHDETAVARFKSETRLAASLEHPNIVPIHSGGEHEGVLYLAMRFIEGTNLRHVIDQGPMDLMRAGRIVAEIAEALDVAHERGLVHRDVKPANILLAGEGVDEHVYLTDFGLTKRLGSVGAMTRAGGWVGTPDYVAPEQIQGHHIDRRADVYSLGCVLFEMLTGHVAYPKDSDMAKLWAHVTDAPPLPRTARPDLVGEFDEIVARATAKRPDDRPATAGELAAAVRDAVVLQEAKRRREAVQATGGGDAARAAATIGAGSMAEPAAQPAAEPPGSADPDGPTPVPVVAAGGGPTGGGGQIVLPRGKAARRRRVSRTAVGVAAASAAAAGILLSLSAGDPTPTTSAAAPKGDQVSADLGPVPTNRVHGAGDVQLRLDGRVATVAVETDGLLDAPHAIHIHAGRQGVCPPATAARRHNGHLAISTTDGLPFYGPPVTSLTTQGGTSVQSIMALPRFPNGGRIRYRRTVRLSKTVAAMIRQHDAVVVVHGDDYNHNGIYDNSLDRSDLDRSLPAEVTTPALCGPLVPSAAPARRTEDESATAQAPSAGGGDVFTASLGPEPGAPDPAPARLCALHAASDGDRIPM